MDAGARKKLIDGVWVAIVAVVMLCVFAYCSTRDGAGDDTVAVPAADAQSVAADLARASAVHGVCYGWQLLNGTTPVSTGSNLGADVRVSSSADRCPKWVEVRGTYRWYPDSSESEDYAQYTITVSAGLAAGIDPAGLERLGAGPSRLLDDPAATILDAAEALPLLAMEAGIARGDVPEATASGSPAPVEQGGSDFLRDRWVLLVITGSFLLAAIGTAVLTWVFTRTKKPKPEAETEDE
ncbi:MAG TPA: hypothetical protein VL738_30180 [Dactylosporangium sp.]|jgi:hypothetical protein|nr:hypothetical protein [Dactylosporangium sp.]